MNAPSPDNIVFVRGTTEGINFVAHAFGEKYLNEGDYNTKDEVDSLVIALQKIASNVNH